MRNSDHWLISSQMILKIGNYMNGGSQRGGAYGFTFQSIEKVEPSSALYSQFLVQRHEIYGQQTLSRSLLVFADREGETQLLERLARRAATDCSGHQR